MVKKKYLVEDMLNKSTRIVLVGEDEALNEKLNRDEQVLKLIGKIDVKDE